MAYKDSILTSLNQLNGAGTTLDDVKRTASSQFEKEGVPTTKHEEWKFTNLAKVFKKDFSTVDAQDLASNPELDKIDQYKVILENGILNTSKTDFVDTDVLEIADLSEKLKDDAFVSNKFNQAFNTSSDSMVALNTALLQGGVYIKVKRSKTTDKPVIIQQLFGANSEGAVAYSRIIVDIEDNAEGTIIVDSTTPDGSSSLSNFVGEVTVGADARFKYYQLQNDTKEASQINNIKISQAKNSVIDTCTVSLNGELIRNNLQISLDDERIESNFAGLYLLDGKTHVDNHTVADHRFPNCVSNELYKGILDEYSRGVFNGKIFVREDAQKTEAYQSNNNILLSDNAIINTKPQLEIWADDVSCSHGCTVGQLDKDALFYLKSRGIGDQKGKALLLEAFVMEVVDTISFEPFAEYVSGLISERFGN